ncbi:CBS domain-containing protein [Flagellimonas allohymeniacidonis]|uniref:CBS domain-containing protein n=1 Tax=Flagellimonas allohymeniacidonis TaxID=2517819 RepID=A0A4Q8QA01_9FLAO|nr:CBS domain-containing protein [Allomuricauda hymeniacidonis]TAI47112.1 CBS domain-containing protein [Allomuricauda hymeniacidonis]
MGEKNVTRHTDALEKQIFEQHLVKDVKALEMLLDRQLFEDDIVRIGAEQELCIIDKHNQPYDINLKLLEEINDPHFTSELASYNLEINLDPFELKGDCFSKVENQLNSLLAKADDFAAKSKGHVLLAGILPTIGMKEVSFEYFTPVPRYMALNNSLLALKGGDFNLKIRGVDELYLRHDSVLFEGCNTSFQMHLQIPSHDFVSSYNWAQAIAGPVLSICCNSPLLMGRELWKETRIALFQQSLDTRQTSYALKDQVPRVGFGSRWAKGSVAEIFKEDISKHRILLTKPIEEDSVEVIESGGIPELYALRLHNGTVYRWNRPCYGVGGGKPHLRIENRYIPSGPSPLDEIANFAFWVGLMKGRPSSYDDMEKKMDFKCAKQNFIKAARMGKETIFIWENEEITAEELILKELLPIAHEGLKKCNVDKADIERLLSIIAQRTSGRTGDQWQVQNYRKLRKSHRPGKALSQLTQGMRENQKNNLPVHQWADIKPTKKTEESGPASVASIMSTKLYTLHEDDYVVMAKAIMEWNNINHIPVENRKGKLVGLLTTSHLQSLKEKDNLEWLSVKDVMVTDVISIDPTTNIKEAKEIMDRNEIGCLPVCTKNKPVGIISIKDL